MGLYTALLVGGTSKMRLPQSGATSVSSIILASIMAVESSTHLEGGLKLMDEKYHLKRKTGPTGLRYILVARVPAQIEIAGNSVGKKRRKLGAQDKEQIDLTAFSLDMDYERLGERHHVQGLHDLREWRYISWWSGC